MISSNSDLLVKTSAFAECGAAHILILLCDLLITVKSQSTAFSFCGISFLRNTVHVNLPGYWVADKENHLVILGGEYDVNVPAGFFHRFYGIVSQNAHTAQKILEFHVAASDRIQNLHMAGNVKSVHLGDFCHEQAF